MNLFDLAAKITLDTDDYEHGLYEAGQSARGFGDTFKRVMDTTVAKTIISAGQKIAGKAVELVKSSVAAYAEYEQLVGGVETLFGKEESGAEAFERSIKGSTEAIKEFQAAHGLAVDGIIGPKTRAAIEEVYGKTTQMNLAAVSKVKENAENAYKTAGMSANEYMQTVTSFSASLLQGLGGDTVKAAEVADMAIRDMSDNANKMGTDMSSIQTAYQGFAKQNYTMLDNLKLGYGGTKTEMERLLRDAEKLTKKKYNLNNLADVYEAIHVIQTEMGITGTTSKEAATTIEGSQKMMAAAWQNFLTSFIQGDEYIDEAIDALIESAEAFARNILPAIGRAVKGIGEAIPKFAGSLAKEAVRWFGKKLQSNASSELRGVGNKLIEQAIRWERGEELDLGDTLKQLAEAFGKWVTLDAIPTLQQFNWGGIWEGITSSSGELIAALIGVLNSIGVDNILDGISGLGEIIFTSIAGAIRGTFNGAAMVITALATALSGTDAEKNQSIQQSLARLGGTIINGIANAIRAAVNGTTTVVTALTELLQGAIDGTADENGEVTASPFAEAIKGAITAAVTNLANDFSWLMWALGDFLTNLVAFISTSLSDTKAESLFGENGAFTGIATALLGAIASGLKAAGELAGMVLPAVTEIIKSVGGFIVSSLQNIGESDLFGKEGALTGIATAFLDAIATVFGELPNLVGGASDVVGGILTALSTLITTALGDVGNLELFGGEGIITGMARSLAGAVIEAIKLLPTLVESVGNVGLGLVDAIGGLISSYLSGDNLDAMFGEGGTFTSVADALIHAIAEAFSTAQEKGGEIITKLAELISGIDWAGVGASLVDLAAHLLGSLVDALNTGDFGENAGNVIKAIGALLLAAVGAIVEFTDSIVEKIIGYLGDSRFWQTLTDAWGSLKSGIETVKEAAQGVLDKFHTVAQPIIDAVNSIVQPIVDAWNSITSAVQDAINAVNEFLGLNSNGGFQEDTYAGKRYKTGGKYHAKSMWHGNIVNTPTVFGVDKNGVPQIAGDAGAEAVVGVTSLDRMIQASVNNAMAGQLTTIAGLVSDILTEVSGGTQIVLDNGALVGALAPGMDRALGRRSSLRGRRNA